MESKNSTSSELASIIDRYSNGDGLHSTQITGLHCFKMTKPNNRLPVIYRPSIYFIAQGAKQVMLENEVFQYTPNKFLTVSVDLPLIGKVTEASPAKPYLCAQIDIDPQKMSELAMQLNPKPPPHIKSTRGLFIGEVDGHLTNAILRLLQLLDTPQDAPYLAPAIFQEIYYRLMVGHHGDTITQMYLKDSNMQRIAQAINLIKADITKSLVIDELAEIANMSASNFYSQFKKVTALSPLQYQKRLRLTQARQAMLTENMDASSAAYCVGYESPSHFNREYARQFGAPPLRDIRRLKSLGFEGIL